MFGMDGSSGLLQCLYVNLIQEEPIQISPGNFEKDRSNIHTRQLPMGAGHCQ